MFHNISFKSFSRTGSPRERFVSCFLLLLLLPGLLFSPLRSAEAAANCYAQHQIKAGETLSSIGRLYGVKWTSIAQANNLAAPDRIYVGQTLCIPFGSTSTPPPGNPLPTFTIVSVVPDQSVTIRTANFPANQRFDILMAPYGSKGINGTYVTSTQSGSGGSFTATYQIPANLHGADRIAIRLQSPSGYYSFNWFFN